MRAFTLALICTLAPLAVQAQSYQSLNRLNVVPLNKTDFEVIEAHGEGPRGIWCAAADYALKRMGLTQGRLYIKSGRAASVTARGRKGVVFTTQDLGHQQSGFSVSTRQVGYSLPVNHAFQFCRDYQYDLNDVLLRRKVFP